MMKSHLQPESSDHDFVLSSHTFSAYISVQPPALRVSEWCRALQDTESDAGTARPKWWRKEGYPPNLTNSIAQWLGPEGQVGGLKAYEQTESMPLASSEESSTDSHFGENDGSHPTSPRIQESETTSQHEDDSIAEHPQVAKLETSSEAPVNGPMETPHKTYKEAQILTREEIITRLDKDAYFQNEFFKVSPSPVAGLGAFAKQDLHEGDIILKEEPLFTSYCRDLFGDFEVLDLTAKRICRGLAKNEELKTGTPEVEALMWTNSFSTGRYGSKGGLFVIAARLNHACEPANSVEFHYDRELRCQILKVVADIPEGNELTICYGRKRSPYNLWTQYGFQCRCGACPGISDEQLRGIDLMEW